MSLIIIDFFWSGVYSSPNHILAVSKRSHHHCDKKCTIACMVCRFDGWRVTVSILRRTRHVYSGRFRAVYDIYTAVVRAAGTSGSILQVDVLLIGKRLWQNILATRSRNPLMRRALF